MQANSYEQLDGSDFSFHIVAARFNQEITDGLVEGCRRALIESGVKADNIQLTRVPGSFELPLAAQEIVIKKKPNAVIVLGAIIKGETPHWDYIAQAVAHGLTRVSLEHKIPVTFGVITAENLDQAQARSANDEHNRGREAALAAVELLNEFKKL